MAIKLAHLLTTLLSVTLSVHAKLRTCKGRNLPAIDVFGIQVIDIHAKEHRGFEDWMPSPFVGIGDGTKRPLDFCNITITYTHPGQNDSINAYIWLPFDDWNGRFLGQGGGGWAAGWEMTMGPSVAAGYATATTDAGHTMWGALEEIGQAEWAMLSPGNLNWVLLQDFASRALDDLPKIAKQVIQGFYGDPAKVSYWNGCSTGGRQGLISAQRFPTNYNGILAAAPAINWASFVVAELWPHVVMKKIGYYPPPCELEAIRQAAIAACDELDGVKDGVIAAYGLCDFDAKSVIGKSYDCDGDAREISSGAADVANAAWKGPHRNGKREWYGNTHDTFFGGIQLGLGDSGVAKTVCDENNRNCKSDPFPISSSWASIVHKNPAYNVTNMNDEDYWDTLHQSRAEFTSIIDTSDPDLSQFKLAGGKMITWHGTADQLIFINGTSQYYERVLELDPGARDFYRYFEAPGVFHCFGGPGAFPGRALESLVKWVEEGIAPDTLVGATMPASPTEAPKLRPLCQYPLVAAYAGGDVSDASSFQCAESFDVTKHHAEL